MADGRGVLQARIVGDAFEDCALGLILPRLRAGHDRHAEVVVVSVVQQTQETALDIVMCARGGHDQSDGWQRARQPVHDPDTNVADRLDGSADARRLEVPLGHIDAARNGMVRAQPSMKLDVRNMDNRSWIEIAGQPEMEIPWLADSDVGWEPTALPSRSRRKAPKAPMQSGTATVPGSNRA